MAKTVAEIGRLAGCSGATVSRALNNSGSVSAKTREAIFKVLRDSQYPTQPTGRRGRPSNRQKGIDTRLVEILFFRETPIERLSVEHGQLAVGSYGFWNSAEALVSSHEISSSFYRHIIDGAVGMLEEWGYKAVLKTSRNLLSRESLEDVNKPDRSGILLLGQYGEAVQRFVEKCIHPLVLVDIIQPGPVDVVTTDNLAGISAAFDHLYSLGHRDIGFVGRFEPSVAFEERYLTYKWKMAEAGLPVNPAWTYTGLNRIDQTAEGVVKILSYDKRPSALLCTNDFAAMGVIRAAASLNISIPQHLSVVGFDDDDIASMVTPPLTTVRTPVADLGRQAVRQLMSHVQHPQPAGAKGVCVRLAPELIVRQSTAKHVG